MINLLKCSFLLILKHSMALYKLHGMVLCIHCNIWVPVLACGVNAPSYFRLCPIYVQSVFGTEHIKKISSFRFRFSCHNILVVSLNTFSSNILWIDTTCYYTIFCTGIVLLVWITTYSFLASLATY